MISVPEKIRKNCGRTSLITVGEARGEEGFLKRHEED